MWLDRFWLVQALLPESSLLSLLVGSSDFLTDNSSSFAFVTLVHNFLFKPRCMTFAHHFIQRRGPNLCFLGNVLNWAVRSMPGLFDDLGGVRVGP